MTDSSWETLTFGDFLDFKNGLNFNSSAYGEGIKFINVMDIFSSNIITEKNINGSIKLSGQNITDSLIEYGDIVFNRTSETFNEIALCSTYLGTAKVTFGGFVIRARPKSGFLDPLFSAYCFKSFAVRKELIRHGQGVVRANIGQKDLNKISIELPPLEEQKKIAQVLSTWDEAIKATKKMIANKTLLRMALMNRLLAGEDRLPGFEKPWKDVRLQLLIRELSNRNRDSSIKRVLSVTNQKGFVLPEDQFSKRVASENISNYKIVEKGQFGFNPSRINVGSFARLDDYDAGVLSPMYTVFEINTDKLDSDYFLAWMSSNQAKQRIGSSTQGSVRKSVSFNSLCRIPFKLPPLDEQKALSSILNKSSEEISALKRNLSCLTIERDGLIQQLLSGKRRIQAG